MPGATFFGEEVLYNSMDRWIGTTAVVTGASSGIGAAICEVLVKLGVNVVGVARRAEMIQDLAENLRGERGILYAHRCDLSDESAIDELFTWIEDNLGPIAILVNNAGLLKPTSLLGGEAEEWRFTLDVNVMALCICTKKAVKSMKKHGQDGHIIHMNSITGHYMPEMPVPCLNMYAPSKFAVTAITEQHRRELRAITTPTIKISGISPGLVTTDIIEGFTAEGGVRDGLKQLQHLKPEDIADTLVYVLSTPPHVQIHDIIIKVRAEAF